MTLLEIFPRSCSFDVAGLNMVGWLFDGYWMNTLSWFTCSVATWSDLTLMEWLQYESFWVWHWKRGCLTGSCWVPRILAWRVESSAREGTESNLMSTSQVDTERPAREGCCVTTRYLCFSVEIWNPRVVIDVLIPPSFLTWSRILGSAVVPMLL